MVRALSSYPPIITLIDDQRRCRVGRSRTTYLQRSSPFTRRLFSLIDIQAVFSSLNGHPSVIAFIDDQRRWGGRGEHLVFPINRAERAGRDEAVVIGHPWLQFRDCGRRDRAEAFSRTGAAFWRARAVGRRFPVLEVVFGAGALCVHQTVQRRQFFGDSRRRRGASQFGGIRTKPFASQLFGLVHIEAAAGALSGCPAVVALIDYQRRRRIRRPRTTRLNRSGPFTRRLFRLIHIKTITRTLSRYPAVVALIDYQRRRRIRRPRTTRLNRSGPFTRRLFRLIHIKTITRTLSRYPAVVALIDYQRRRRIRRIFGADLQRTRPFTRRLFRLIHIQRVFSTLDRYPTIVAFINDQRRR